ncbi:sigma-70 family RNA polymerase sigma factor [Rhodoblastus acidophilus]|uniref:RNA polymerase sigma factor n=1 Tax=Rhodoblastus acidophilus TaxID=1074 RepID=A0A6N8DUG8_RHOAC|nr:sigma-70 family RNA polymerase sigma factor [Rhodoblastus acidophilus]MCW2276168.1 RNA polymerase sigma-70 factor (ECF subfamily) [Rhodoblastus acidophilus]MTV32833.1 sigma-70 family RNA polymerase sigma factor [Rhodoblastus acidophilus]
MGDAKRPDADFKSALLAEIPQLRFFALSLSGHHDRADDLVQDTLIKAWAAQQRFTPGSSLRAWLFTIMRNTFYSNYRKARREAPDRDGDSAARLFVNPEQTGHLDLDDLKTALAKLPEDQRVALLLVGATGLSYEEAAQICGCALGTIKSRVNRARRKLMAHLAIESVGEFGAEFLAIGGSLAPGEAA